MIRRAHASFLAGAAFAAAGLGACVGAEDDDGTLHFPQTVLVENPDADSVTFWPRHVLYARYGDTLFATIHGLKRVAECAEPSLVSWNFSQDTAKNQSYRPRARFVIPGGSTCRADTVGLDTTFKVVFFTSAGKRMRLLTPGGKATDSVLFVDAASVATVDVFTRAPGDPDSLAVGRFTFLDSTAARPRRMIRADSLAACEFLQSAVHERRDDTLRVRLRRIEAAPLPAGVLPPCAGPRADSIEVEPDLRTLFP